MAGTLSQAPAKSEVQPSVVILGTLPEKSNMPATIARKAKPVRRRKPMMKGTIHLPKFCVLQERLGLPKAYAIGVLEGLWLFAQHCAPDGDLSKYTPQEIQCWMGVPCDPDELVDALVDSGWLDRTGESLVIHDWAEHCPRWCRARVAERKARLQSEKSDTAVRAKVTLQSDFSDTAVRENPTLQPPEKGHSLPIPSLPLNIDRSIGDRPKVLEVTEVDEQAYERLRPTMRWLHEQLGSGHINETDRRTAIVACLIADCALGDDWLRDIVAGYRRNKGNVKSPWKYLRKSFVTGCQQHGLDFHAIEQRTGIMPELLKAAPPPPIPAGTA